jgi:hypothetical protein
MSKISLYYFYPYRNMAFGYSVNCNDASILLECMCVCVCVCAHVCVFVLHNILPCVKQFVLPSKDIICKILWENENLHETITLANHFVCLFSTNVIYLRKTQNVGERPIKSYFLINNDKNNNNKKKPKNSWTIYCPWQNWLAL